jgi:hypothetical protein
MKVSDITNKGLVERVADLLDMDVAPASNTHPTKAQIQSWLREGYVKAMQILDRDAIADIVTAPSGQDMIVQVSFASITAAANGLLFYDLDAPAFGEFLHIIGVHEVFELTGTKEYTEVKNIHAVNTAWTDGSGYWSRTNDGSLVVKPSEKGVTDEANIYGVFAVIPDFGVDTSEIAERIAPLLVKYAFASAQYQDEDEQSSLVNMKDFYQEVSILNGRYSRNAKLPD